MKDYFFLYYDSGKPWVFKKLNYFSPNFFSYTSLCEANQLSINKPIFALFFSINSFSVNGCNFGVPMGGGNLWVFLLCIIGHTWVAVSNAWFGLASLR